MDYTPIANIMNLMRGAGRLARKRGSDQLETDILATVFDKRLAKHLNKTINPFCVSLETQFAAPHCSPLAQDITSGKKKNRRKEKKQTSISKTLSTR